MKALWVLFTAVIVLIACGQPAASPIRSADSAPDGSAPIAPKTLIIALEGEPGNLDSGIEGGGLSPTGVQLAVHDRLAGYNERGQLVPRLAVSLPSQTDGTWIIRPNGTMQTTYRIHRNVIWHDGTPLTSRDFVFALTMHQDKDLPVGPRTSAAALERIETPDDFTLIMVIDEDLGPLPAHILDPPYREDKERFVTLPYWKREFIGVGPYRVVEWEPGSHLTVKAHEQYYGGRPKIETVQFRFIPNPATAMANLLAGAIDGVIPRAVDFSQAMFVKDEWLRAGKQPSVFVEPTHWRLLSIQFREGRTDPPELRDVQVRRGLLHAIDRTALVNALLDGQAPISDGIIPPVDPKWDWVKDVAIRYDYDPRRALELLRSVGWQRSDGGPLVNANGQQVSISTWTTPGEQNVQEQAIVSDYWKALGINVIQTIIPQAQQRDRELRTAYPAFDQTSVPLAGATSLYRVHSAHCAREPQWNGNNRGCYENPAMDRIVDGLALAINPDEERRLFRDLIRFYAEELPVLPLYFNVEVTVFRDGITGLKGNSKPRTSHTWNIQEWDVVDR
ncbi:MAG: hypothetical protein HW416_208 [Chloroflexi bacterium]|nr:hypothetical protein [Chloroflexota bacterium]